jgi:hypothetical protein
LGSGITEGHSSAPISLKIEALLCPVVRQIALTSVGTDVLIPTVVLGIVAESRHLPTAGDPLEGQAIVPPRLPQLRLIVGDRDTVICCHVVTELVTRIGN